MPVVVITEWRAQDTAPDTTNYDAISEQLDAANDPPPGMLLHAAGYTPDNRFQIIEIWTSRQHAEQFRRERLGPAVARRASPNAEPPATTTYETHAMIRP